MKQRSKIFSKLLTIIILVAMSNLVYAGAERCETQQVSKAQLINGGQLASKVLVEIKKLESEYENKGQELKVLILARRGTDPGGSVVLKDFYDGKFLELYDYAEIAGVEGHNRSNIRRKNIRHILKDKKRQLKYSHLGFAFKNHPKGRWFFIHELNPCQTKTSNLYNESMWNFFLDDPFKYGAAIYVPKQNIQNRIEQVILDDELSMNFHGNVYNALSLPFSTAEQNSNQWALEVLAAAIAPRGEVLNRSEAQNVLYQTNYTPTRMVTGFYHSLGLVFSPDSVNFRPHKYASNLNLIEVITVLSIKEYMQRNNFLDQEVEVELEDFELIIDDSEDAEKKHR